MNKKLALYIGLFAGAIAVSVKNYVKFDRETWRSTDDPAIVGQWEYAETPAFYFITDTLYKGENGYSVSQKSSTYYYDVYVKPKLSADKRTLVSSIGDQTYKVSLQKVRIIVPADKSGHNYFIFRLISFLISTGVYIWIICLIFGLLRKLRPDEVFVEKVSRRMETTGILLSSLFIFQWIILFIMNQYCIKHFELANYAIVDKVDANGMLILTGLGLMIFSQIIMMGKELKEEQELTI